MIKQLFLLFTGVSICLNPSLSPHRLSSFLNANSDFSNFNDRETLTISLPDGIYIGDNIGLAHRWMELTGKPSTEKDDLTTELIALPLSDLDWNTDNARKQDFGSFMFSLTNSTLWLKSIDFSLFESSSESRQEKNQNHSPRLAIVSGSMLTIFESRIEQSPWTSAIVISLSTLEESAMESSVVLTNCSIWNDVGEMRGVVETSAFPSFGGSVSVSIVGSSFDSHRILGNDGIGLSLTQTSRKRSEEVGMISSSLIGCSFVNMSSFGSSCPPQLSHLSQKMLGCVVSLTSSHLSGSTIRDVNDGGSVLCSNSSFSSLLSSPTANPEPSITLPDYNGTAEFMDGAAYYYNSDFGTSDSQANFSHCHFTAGEYPQQHRPLSFYDFKGTISILSCSFTNISSPESYGGGVAYIVCTWQCVSPPFFTVTSSNFTNCSSPGSGGAVYVSLSDEALITSCRFKNCSTTGEYSEGGGLRWDGYCSYVDPSTKLLKLIGCVFADCSSSRGGGVRMSGYFSLSVIDTKFERCEAISDTSFTLGAGLDMTSEAVMKVERSEFIGCSSSHIGGAIFSVSQRDLIVSDTLVKDCSSGITGAIYTECNSVGENFSFFDVLFVGNSVGEDPSSMEKYMSLAENTTTFPDVAIMCFSSPYLPPLTFEDCFSTVSPDSSGMVIRGTKNPSSGLYDTERHLDAEFDKIGPLLTAAPAVTMNDKTGKIGVELKGKTPLSSQEYEVTVKEEENGTVTSFRMLFLDGTGTLVSDSEISLKYNTNYTITSIVGVVPPSSSSSVSNNIPIPVAAWAFNLAANTSFFTFTTPKPPFFISATSSLILDEPKFAHVLIVFDEKVKGSFDIVVEEDGKDVTITVPILTEALAGDSQKFVVVGDDRVLTHNTTYTIKSFTPTPGTDTMFVCMNETITFHIPESSFVPPPDPVEDPKKRMSPETKALLSWLIPLVACLLLTVVIAVIVIVLLRRRQKKKNGEPAQKEMEAQEPLDVEKVEEFGVHFSDGVIRTDANHESVVETSDSRGTRVSETSELMNSECRKGGDLVEVMACSGDFGISRSRMDCSLYNVLHKERRVIGKRAVGIQIVNGLKHVVGHRGWSDVLTRLSSHWIVIDGSGNVQLKLQMTSEEAEQEATRAQSNDHPQPNLEENKTQPHEVSQGGRADRTGMDGLRWRAPEVVGSKGGEVDGSKASVFSLGLLLWEIETGQVPFGELDAVNAQRQSGTGVGPKMESLQNSEFVSLIHRCVSVDPEERPTLSEIEEFLSSHPEDTRIGSGPEMKEPEA
ncbi:hypothetical protein BLNAU_11699 [Blattamonas nauphoetae]|uniref:Protein kinase domain-containing protein n=1 Tax=Blattamonas nauphoetae TaxID=2049346 RepID=A0ABQ9XLW4_9EUKA|nr:hypothetical protein BLNAU_11699 [Blattamonas nauphoetae]